ATKNPAQLGAVLLSVVGGMAAGITSLALLDKKEEYYTINYFKNDEQSNNSFYPNTTTITKQAYDIGKNTADSSLYRKDIREDVLKNEYDNAPKDNKHIKYKSRFNDSDILGALGIIDIAIALSSLFATYYGLNALINFVATTSDVKIIRTAQKELKKGKEAFVPQVAKLLESIKGKKLSGKKAAELVAEIRTIIKAYEFAAIMKSQAA
ncbi:hypothetical protein KAU11_04880, partial [Candidatus Babeliales bacterium]|nr:hypothetical protein [Candidatus Babeliales bacterium]